MPGSPSGRRASLGWTVGTQIPPLSHFQSLCQQPLPFLPDSPTRPSSTAQEKSQAILTSPRFLCNSVSSSWCLILSCAISCSWLSFHAPSCPGLPPARGRGHSNKRNGKIRTPIHPRRQRNSNSKLPNSSTEPLNHLSAPSNRIGSHGTARPPCPPVILGRTRYR